jgi:hypothetical protein
VVFLVVVKVLCELGFFISLFYLHNSKRALEIVNEVK